MARDRIRAGTMGAEDVLHDLGVIPITSSDAQGMGRAGETVRRTFARGGKMKAELGGWTGRRRAARQRPDPALHRQADDQSGHRARTRARGRLARGGQAGRHRAVGPGLLRRQAATGAQGGLPGLRRDRRPQRGHRPLPSRWCSARSSARTARPPADLSVAFVSGAAADAERRPLPDPAPPRRRCAAPAASARRRWCATPGSARSRSAPATGLVTLDGDPVCSPPAETVPLSRLYFL